MGRGAPCAAWSRAPPEPAKNRWWGSLRSTHPTGLFATKTRHSRQALENLPPPRWSQRGLRRPSFLAPVLRTFELRQGLAASHRPHGDQGSQPVLPGPGLAVLPVEDRQPGNAHQLAVIGRRQAQPLALRPHRSGRMPDAVQLALGGGLRLVQPLSLLGFEEGGLPLLLLEFPLQLGDVPAILDDGLLRGGGGGLDLSFRQAADFVLEDGGNVGHGGVSWVI